MCLWREGIGWQIFFDGIEEAYAHSHIFFLKKSEVFLSMFDVGEVEEWREGDVCVCVGKRQRGW